MPNTAGAFAVVARRCIPMLGMAALLACLTITSQAAGGFFLLQGSGRPRLASIAARVVGTTTTVAIEATEPVPYVTTQPDPLTLLVELRNVTSAGVKNLFAPRNQRAVSSVTVDDFKSSDGALVARVRINLALPATHRVHSSRTMIYVDVEPALGSPAPGATSGQSASLSADEAARRARAAEVAKASPMIAKPAAAGAAPAATLLRAIATAATPEGVSVTLSGNGRLQARSIEPTKDSPPRLVIDLPGVSSSVAPLTLVKQGPVERIRVAAFSTQPLVTRVVIDLTEPGSTPRIESVGANGQDLRLVFPAAAAVNAAANERPTPPAALPAPVKTEVVSADPIRPEPAAPPSVAEVGPRASIGPSDASAPLRRTPAKDAGVLAPTTRPTNPSQAPLLAAAQQPPPPPTTPPPAQAPAPPLPPTPPVITGPSVTTTLTGERGQKQYTGSPVSFDFQDVDLRTVLRVFAQETGLNIVIDPAVTGTVNVSLRDVPWDQALDIILRTNKLGYSIEGNVVRIVPLTTLQTEEEAAQKLRETQALAGDIRLYTKTLSYAKADDLKTLLTDLLSQKGKLQVDPRTNMIIVNDLPGPLAAVENLIALLDRPQPQVEIEARIVQSNRDFARTIGVQWGLAGRAAPELGNTTGLAFPNSGAITGRTGGVQPGVPQGVGQTGNNTPTGVNLPVTGATTAIGLALGAVNGAFNLDLALSALENSGQGRILSTPRVSTQNNVEASIVQGIQIPIQVISNNTVSVTFQDAALTLRVTPQITAAGTVIMRVSLNNGSADFSRAINGIPPINKQAAETTLLVNDGDTTVIGGIYTNEEQLRADRTPGLNRIPLLGWLFKRDSITDQSRELLIFLTPRIIKS